MEVSAIQVASRRSRVPTPQAEASSEKTPESLAALPAADVAGTESATAQNLEEGSIESAASKQDEVQITAETRVVVEGTYCDAATMIDNLEIIRQDGTRIKLSHSRHRNDVQLTASSMLSRTVRARTGVELGDPLRERSERTG